MTSFILLVTWIVAGQPANSYQAVFSSEQACKMARVGVLVEGQRIREEFEKRAVAGATGSGVPPATYLMASPPPSVAATCAKQ
jgi:hypothetical protein